MARSFANVVRVLALRGLGMLISLGTAVGIAFHFGAGPLTDAFFLVRRMFGSIVLLVESLCNAILVPGFVRTARTMDQASYLRALRRREMAFFSIGATLGIVVIFFSPQLVNLMAPALNPQAAEAAALFLALMALTLPITLSTAFVGSALMAIRQFSLPVAVKLAPRVLILLAVLLVPLGMGMTGIVIAAVLGHLVMLGALWWVRRKIAALPATNAQHPKPELAEQTKTATPARAAALTVLAVYFLAVIISESYVASLVGVGAVAILGLGQRISTLGVSEMLNSVLAVYYTNFSEKADHPEALIGEVRAALATGYFFTAPLTLCLAVLAPGITQLILANGAFSEQAAAQAGALVAWFALAALVNTGMSIFETAILARSDRNMVWHMSRACLVTLSLRILTMILLVPSWGLSAIGLAAVLGPVVMALFHHRFLSRRIGVILQRDLLIHLGKIAFSAALCAAICLAVQWLWPVLWPAGSSKLLQALMLITALALAIPAYLWSGTRLGIPDAQRIAVKLTRRRKTA